MDALIGGVTVALGLVFVVVGAMLHRTLDVLAWALVVAGGVIVALFGLAIASSGLPRPGNRRRPVG